MNLAELQELAAQQRAARQAAADFASVVRRALGRRVEWIRLYGSLARGDWMGPDESDIDVAIVLRERSDEDVDRIIRLTTEHLTKSGLVFSPRVFTAEEFDTLLARELRIARDIVDEGRLL
jgi:predicted nucleotidyltransferase